MFHVGQKVVCVDAKRFEVYLTQGAIYTVTSINFPWLRVDCTPGPLVQSEESRCGYKHTRFRPLTETKISTSFTEGAPEDSERWDNRKIKADS